MSNTVIKIENLSKLYRLGVWGTGTLKDDLSKSWAKFRGKSDPTKIIGQSNELSTMSKADGDNHIWALRDINLEVKQGDILGIIGKNGAGKSTLLKILSQITGPTSGSIKMKGRVASLLEVGTGMHGELTGKENILLNGAILGMKKSEIKSKFDEIVDFAGIAKYIETPIKRYSSGMNVRLGFAIAAFLEPEILIVDEVLAVGDAEFQKKAIGKMQDVSKGEGRTVLFVSHNMASVRSLCTKGILLKNGQLSKIGKTSDIIDSYLTSENVNNEAFERTKEMKSIAYFENITIAKNNDINNNFSIGDSIVIELSIVILKDITDIKFSLILKDKTGTPIVHTNNEDANFNCGEMKENKYKFKVVFDDFRLYPDTYLLDAYITSKRTHDKYDVVENCLSFTITDAGKYTSRALPVQQARIFLTPSWNLL